MTVYIITKSCLWRHDIIGVYDTPEAASQAVIAITADCELIRPNYWESQDSGACTRVKITEHMLKEH